MISDVVLRAWNSTALMRSNGGVSEKPAVGFEICTHRSQIFSQNGSFPS